MTPGRAARAAVLVLPLLAPACAPDAGEPAARGAPDGEVAVVDDEGRTVALERSPERIVSLVPSAGEILRALGAGERIVGRTDFDTASAAARLPSVGGGLRPSLEAIVALDPDLVIRFAGETDRQTPARLDALGIPHMAIRPDRVADVGRITLELGRIVGREEAAESAVARLDDGLDAVRADAAGREPVRAVFLLGGTPPYVAGPGTFIDELLTLAGGRNVFADLGRRYAAVSVEELLAREIDVFLAVEGAEIDDRGVGDRPVRRVTPLVQIPGLRLDEAARAVARALHPDGGR